MRCRLQPPHAPLGTLQPRLYPRHRLGRPQRRLLVVLPHEALAATAQAGHLGVQLPLVGQHGLHAWHKANEVGAQRGLGHGRVDERGVERGRGGGEGGGVAEDSGTEGGGVKLGRWDVGRRSLEEGRVGSVCGKVIQSVSACLRVCML